MKLPGKRLSDLRWENCWALTVLQKHLRMKHQLRSKLLHVFISLFQLVISEISLPTEPDYTSVHKSIWNITKTYAERRTFMFMTEEVESSDFMKDLLNVVDGPREIVSPSNLTYQQGFFIFNAKKNRFYSKILERMVYTDNTRFLLIWINPEPSILYIRSIFQEFWNYEMLDVIALVQMKYRGLSVYTYFPYTKSQCADAGAPIMIDTWSPHYNRFTRKTNLYDRRRKIYNLHGCALNCAGVHRPPDSIIEGTGNKTYNLSGIGGRLFETIALKMNFTPIITRVIDSTSNYDAIYTNDSSIVSMDVGTKKVDIGFGIFTRLLDNHPKIVFVKETNMDCFTWAVPANAGVGPSMWTTYIGEFSAITWILIAFNLILAIFVFYFLTHLALNEGPHFKNWEFLSFFVYFTFLGASVEEKPHSNVLRMFFAPWLFYCLVLGAAYNAQLGSYATVPTKDGNIENIHQLLETDFSITGAPQMFYVLNASINTSYTIKMLLKRFEVLPPGNILPVIEKVVIERNMAVFSTRGLLSYSNECLKSRKIPTSYLQPVCVIKSPSSPVIVRRTYPLQEPLSDIITRLFETGILSRWEDNAKQQWRGEGFHYEPKLYLEQMQAAFLLLISGLLLSVIVFVGELITYKWICPPPDLIAQLIAQGYKIPFRH